MWLGARCWMRRPSGCLRALTGGFNFCLLIYQDWSCTFENLSNNFQDHIGGGAAWSQDQKKECGEQGKYLYLPTILYLVSWTHYLVTFPCNFYLISFIMYILSCILLIGFILYLAHKFYLISCTSSFILYLAQSGEQTDGWNRGAAESHCSPCRGSTACLQNVKQIECSNWSINW